MGATWVEFQRPARLDPALLSEVLTAPLSGTYLVAQVGGPGRTLGPGGVPNALTMAEQAGGQGRKVRRMRSRHDE